MPDPALVREILRQMLEAIGRIERRASGLTNPNDFMNSDEGIDKLDAICMMLVAIGESCKHLDRITNGQLFAGRPEIDWKGVMGIRDVISHHYFDINADMVYSVCRNRIPELKTALESLYGVNSEI
jgi:uncharacterized protein with HEPN domain